MHSSADSVIYIIFSYIELVTFLVSVKGEHALKTKDHVKIWRQQNIIKRFFLSSVVKH